jgi:hypothetical protein
LITDWLVDGYFPVFDRLGEVIEDLEIDVINTPNKWVVERIFAVRRDLLQIRHAVNPQREIFNQMTNRDLTLIKPERLVYFRDVYDHLIRLTDELDSYRELVSTTLDIYVSQINNNLSEIMKRLTAVTVVLAGIAAIGGIFGMSEAGTAFNLQEGWASGSSPRSRSPSVASHCSTSGASAGSELTSAANAPTRCSRSCGGIGRWRDPDDPSSSRARLPRHQRCQLLCHPRIPVLADGHPGAGPDAAAHASRPDRPQVRVWRSASPRRRSRSR